MTGTHAVVAIGVLFDQVEVVLDTDHWTRVAGQLDDGQRTEDGVDRPPFKTQLTQMSSREQRLR